MASVLAGAYAAFVGDHADMDGKTFVKVCKDSLLVDKAFTPTDADLVFAKVVPKGHRRISLEEFAHALECVATKKGLPAAEVFDLVAGSGGPTSSGTVADAVRFHDDKSTYTGVHVNGGPESVPKGEGHVPPSQVFSRAPATLAPAAGPRRRSTSPRPDLAVPGSSGAGTRSTSRPTSSEPRARAAASPPSDGPPKSISDVFAVFCGAGHGDMDGKSFVKLCKDTHLVDRAFTPTDVDLIFAKAAPKGHRRITLEEFKEALNLVAAKKGITADQVFDMVSRSGGPTSSGTVADAVRFHDDKSTYTGVHINGGPESVAKGGGTATQLASSGMRTGQ